MSKQKVTKEKLIKLYIDNPDTTLQSVADKLGASRSAVMNAMRRYGLESRNTAGKPKVEIFELSDKAWLEQKYINEDLSADNIGKLLNCSETKVLNAIRKHNIIKEVKYPELKDKEWLKKKYVDENLSGQQIGELLGCTKYPVLRALRKHGLGARVHSSKYPQLNDKEWLHDQYIAQGKSVKQIANDVGAHVGGVHSALTHMGIKTRDPKEAWAVKFRQGRFGKKAANWQGGRSKSTNGHIYIYSPEHPYSNKQGYVMEHRLVMEKAIGRYLAPEEIIHHINMQKQDNTIDNLYLCADNGAHRDIHHSLELAGASLVNKKGTIKFIDGKYYTQLDESMLK
jgi:biotin operon repressor